MGSLAAQVARHARAVLDQPRLKPAQLDEALRERPGVYVAHDRSRPVYVGMSNNLRRRVLHQHLGSGRGTSRLQHILHAREGIPFGDRMRERVAQLEWQVWETSDSDWATCVEGFVILHLRHERVLLWNRPPTGAEADPDPRASRPHEVTREAVVEAMREHRLRYPRPNDYERWLDNPRFRYAVWHRRRPYPPKAIWSLAAGIPTDRFRGGSQVNGWFERLRFTVTEKPTPSRA